MPSAQCSSCKRRWLCGLTMLRVQYAHEEGCSISSSYPVHSVLPARGGGCVGFQCCVCRVHSVFMGRAGVCGRECYACPVLHSSSAWLLECFPLRMSSSLMQHHCLQG
eukprot:1161513-Pelagomonas_calceolata.AAC.4